MALVLDRKYAGANWVFLFNRVVRLYPAFIVLSFFSLFLQAVALEINGARYGSWYCIKTAWPYLSHPTQLYLVLSNLFIEGKDLTMFLLVDRADLKWGTVASNGTAPAHYFQLLPQAWSLGLEFNFYLLSPWLLKLKSRWLFAVVATSFGVRWALMNAGLTGPVWDYRFFPAELGLFVAGALAYRLRSIGFLIGRGGWNGKALAAGLLAPVMVLGPEISGGGAWRLHHVGAPCTCPALDI
jgi:peptidoglycan/LPS O-acetylase OafA/YrhL